LDPYQEFTGINRGNSSVHLEDKSDFCQKTAWEIEASGELCPMTAFLDYYQSNPEKTSEEIYNDTQQLLCDEYSSQYTPSRHPDWLSHCDFANEDTIKLPSIITINPNTGEPNRAPIINSITVVQLD